MQPPEPPPPSRSESAARYRRVERWRRLTEITNAYGPYCRLNLAEVGSQWGEGEWTDRDLWVVRSRLT